MKKFSFSMQKILDLREFEKKQAESELSKAVAEETRIQDLLNDVAQKRAYSVSAADRMNDILSLYNVNQYFNLLEQKKEQLLNELTQAKLVTEEKREIMRDKMQKCKVLENLKENRKLAWKKQMMKEEENAIDEIVTSRFKGDE